MSNCQTCQSQLLHHLYGLLDDAEHQAVVAHLGGCADCRAALDIAREQQQILAAAAKAPFPDVRFKAVEQPVAKKLPMTVRRPIVRRRWAMAACIFLAVGGAVGYPTITWINHNNAVSRAQAELNQARIERDTAMAKQQGEQAQLQGDIARIQQQLELVEIQYRNDLARVKKQYDSQPVEFTVSHPKTLQAGGPNQITIEAKRKAGVASAKNLDLIAMVVEDKTKAELARTSLKEGTNDFVLPANLPLKPGTQVSLRVLASETGQKDATLIDESLPLVTSLYVTHLMTDRPLYRPGEVVHFRSLTLERFSLKAAEDEFVLLFRFVRMMGEQEQGIEVADPATGKSAQMIGSTRLTDKNGTPLLGPDGTPIRGIGAGEFLLPAELPGGEYTLIVSEASERFPAERRKIIVNRYQAPRLLKDVDLTRKSYGPGDTVTAVCKVALAEGGKAIVNKLVKATAAVDGQACELLTTAPLATDERGQCTVQFKLPSKIERGEGTLTVEFTDGANVETTVEPIPIVLNKLKVEFFPEGGELVAGVPNRVYFQVRTMLGKPAEMQGKIVNQAGKEIAVIRTLSDDKEIGVNQGMGRFDFTPVEGQRYELQIASPSGIEGKFWLPPVQNTGGVLHLVHGVVTDKIDMVLHSVGKDRKLLVGAYCRGQLLDHEEVKVIAGQAKALTLKPAAQVGGVYRVTVFEDENGKLTPIAERLLYRHSPDKLHLQIATDKKDYIPGDRVTLSLKASDQHNKQTSAIVVVSVVDKSILKLRNDRTARAMPSHFLLTSEVRGPEDLEYADFLLLDESRSGIGFDVAKAHTALDLLLGTQGWRRFVQSNPSSERERGVTGFKEDIKRLLADNGQAPQQQVKESPVSQSAAKVISAAAIKHEKLQREFRTTEAKLAANLQSKADQEQRLGKAVVATSSAVTVAETERQSAIERLKSVAIISLIAAIGAFSLVLVVIGLARANKERPFAPAFLLGGVTCLTSLMVGGMLWLGDVAKPGSEKKELHAAWKNANSRDSVRKQEPNWVPYATNSGSSTRKDMPQIEGGGANAGRVESAPLVQQLRKELAITDKLAGFSGSEASAKNTGLENKEEKTLRPLGKIDVDAAFKALSQGQDAIDIGKPVSGPVSPREYDLPLGSKNATGDARVPLGYKNRPKIGNQLVTADAFALREYAHQHKTSADDIRRDFAETIYWHPALVLPGDKALDVPFDLSDAVTQFQVQVYGHTLGGQLGAATKDIASRLPFSLDAKLPIEISSSDKIAIPIALTNDTDKNRHIKLNVETSKLKLLDPAEYLLPIAGNSRIRQVVRLQPEGVQGDASIRLIGLSEPFAADAIERSFKIVPEGFPAAGKFSGMLDKKIEDRVQLPAKRGEWVPGTLKLRAEVIPSTLAELQKGLEGLLREPGGCFEQTSSSNYPNVMILDYLKESGQIRPDIEKQARAMLERGYNRLITFECANPSLGMKKEGYEWFGNTAPPHPALTAYGLLQFTDMARHMNIDTAMLERTKGWLLSQRDKKGGFLRSDRRLDQIGSAPDAITNAYILWALCEAGVRDDITLELNTVTDNATRSEDPYIIALAGLSLLKRGQADKALPLLKTLKAMQKADGSLHARETSITKSGGSQLTIETTSLAVLAWLRAGAAAEFGSNTRKAVEWIGQNRGAFGGYGSTQSTVLALKALTAFTHDNKRTAESGELRLMVNGKQVAVKGFASGAQDPLVVELSDESLLGAGQNAVSVEITGQNVFPYALSWSYMALTPVNKDVCPVRLRTEIAADKASEGQSLRVTAALSNVSGTDQGMAVAIVGLPGGCMLPTDLQELKNLRDAGKIDHFEIRGRELVLYWRTLAKDAVNEVSFSVICQVPGTYRGPASRAYLYYNTDERWWVSPLAVDIAAK